MSTTTSESLATFESLLDAQGLHAGLLFLNQRVPHRFTALYRLGDQRLRRLGFIDKLGGFGAEFADVPFKNSFCEVAVQENGLIVTDSARDVRVEAVPNAACVGSYVGLPISGGPGELLGTLCHYDTVPHPAVDQEFEFLSKAIQRLGRFCRSAVSQTASPRG